MKAIEAIDEELEPLLVAEARTDITPRIALEAPSAIEEERVRDILRSASAVLSDSATTLYSGELEDIQGVAETQEPDDDRAAGRLDHARLDLLSE